ncbi:LPP20 family lipoprotein [Sulfurimonas sp.]
MKYSFVLIALLSLSTFAQEPEKAAKPDTMVQTIPAPTETTINVVCPEAKMPPPPAVAQAQKDEGTVLGENKPLLISVVGQGVAPTNTSSPAQAYALAKRAATADAYRLIAEKVKGVRIDGQDLIKNMMVQRSTVRTSVQAMVRNANIVETTFKEGLCEVEMEILLSHSQFAQ